MARAKIAIAAVIAAMQPTLAAFLAESLIDLLLLRLVGRDLRAHVGNPSLDMRHFGLDHVEQMHGIVQDRVDLRGV